MHGPDSEPASHGRYALVGQPETLVIVERMESAPFFYATKVVDYYRGKTGDPQGPGTGEPNQLFGGAEVTLNWDQVRQSGKRELIEEPPACSPSDPPVHRCLSEPASTSVTNLRRKYGMVFKITFPSRNYFIVYKDGQTVSY